MEDSCCLPHARPVYFTVLSAIGALSRPGCAPHPFALREAGSADLRRTKETHSGRSIMIPA